MTSIDHSFTHTSPNMIKGLKKDHNILADLIFSDFQFIQESLKDLFDIFIEVFQNGNSAKLLECIYIKQRLAKLNVSEKYLQTITTLDNITSLIDELDSEASPVFIKALTVLTSIHDDYIHTPYASKFDLSIILDTQTDFAEILTKFSEILTKFAKFIVNCETETSFSPSSLSYQDIIIVNFENYDSAYNELFNELYYLEEMLKDWKECIRKNSPCFEEYTKHYHAHTLDKKLLDDEILFDDVFEKFDLTDFEKFSRARKIKLGLDKRRLFSDL